MNIVKMPAIKIWEGEILMLCEKHDIYKDINGNCPFCNVHENSYKKQMDGAKNMVTALITQAIHDAKNNRCISRESKARNRARRFLRGEGFVTCLNFFDYHNARHIETMRVAALEQIKETT